MMTMPRFPFAKGIGIAGLSVLALCLAAPVARAQVGYAVPAGQPRTEAQAGALIAAAVPMEMVVEGRGPMRDSASLPVAPETSEGPIRIREGFAGRAESLPGTALRFDTPQAAGPDGARPEDFGRGNRNSIYHFTDYLLTPYPVSVYPYRAVGKLFFTLRGFEFVCTAALIGPSIIVTAGHCLNDGDGEFASQALFVPAYSSAAQTNDTSADAPSGDLYDRCWVTHMWTTPEWNSGLGLAYEYDVAVALCDRTHSGERRGRLIGRQTGWLGFCYRNCRLPYFMDTQVGYPVNYYGGGEMTVSQHLAETVSGVINGWPTGAFVHGTAMTGGASGGPHIMNAGVIDETSDQGVMPVRNVTLAVTSFRVGDLPMLASVALSGVNNSINFRRMFNVACRQSRRSLGRNSCDPIR